MPKDEPRGIEEELRGIANSSAMMFENGCDPSQRMFDSSSNSMYIEDDLYSSSNDVNDMSWQASATSDTQFLSSVQKNGTASGPRRSSVFMSPAGIGAMLDVDFDDSDSDDDNCGHASDTVPSSSGIGGGDLNHRPLVGGFAAAAYEAARADHYKKQQSEKPSVPAKPSSIK